MGSLHGTWRASSCLATSLPLPHLPCLTRTFLLLALPCPAASPPVSGAGWMTHAQVTSMVFTGPMGHLLILTQTNVGIQNKCGYISEVTSLSGFFPLHSNSHKQEINKSTRKKKKRGRRRSHREAILWSPHLIFWG